LFVSLLLLLLLLLLPPGSLSLSDMQYDAFFVINSSSFAALPPSPPDPSSHNTALFAECQMDFC